MLEKVSAMGFNCTFMELKYVADEGAIDGTVVLIVPLWN